MHTLRLTLYLIILILASMIQIPILIIATPIITLCQFLSAMLEKSEQLLLGKTDNE